ncbi:hypothetical protein HAV15_003170 [Penicillium sp. str. |nr:hypothetical protein HAV15_003170 [Penicillium sp. str. \
MLKPTFKQIISNAPSVIASFPGMTRYGSMSALITKPKSYNTPGQFKRVPIVAHGGQNATDSLPAARASSEEFNVYIPETHEAGHWNKIGLQIPAQAPYLR